MFLSSTPGEECIMFVSVRGDALLYGNPSGCNFIAYGHILVNILTFTLTLLLFLKKEQTIKDTNKSFVSDRLSQSSSVNSGSRRRNRIRGFYSTNVLVLFSLTTAFVILTAIVILAGYIITCGELQYETRRQIHGKTTLGTPLKNMNIACYSLFRDVDFHTRFHYDHREYSGQWLSQYSGYKHGRQIIETTENHTHALPVSIAFELSLSGALLSSIIWSILMILVIMIRRHQKTLQRRIPSLLNVPIYATSTAPRNYTSRQLPDEEVSFSQKDFQNLVPLESVPILTSHPSLIESETHFSRSPTFSTRSTLQLTSKQLVKSGLYDSARAQKDQIDMGLDIGFKCSQI